ncbi:VCBS repeat-containing protein [Pleionea sp. CnH1-48]|uniref:FG-GAP repeat domain-containing protein n=1 Tax=Pleionea sp. CnH1-48 TaxID=2954494 RepID=UPI0020972E9C|nr:VCBS repeat-containing protein [Pleionea sp. CnH1-48]MCO7223250.1 VCBS repeat-containing protein [Pleionea sp. CnH1-48]
MKNKSSIVASILAMFAISGPVTSAEKLAGETSDGWWNGTHLLEGGHILIPVNSKWKKLGSDGSLRTTSFSNIGWNNNPQVMDVNGDGHSDVVLAYNYTWNIMFADGYGGFNKPINTRISNKGWNTNPQVMDINGDGKDDLLVAADGKWKVLISNGRGFNTHINTNRANTGWNNNPQVLDVNGDGMDDLVVAYNYTWNIFFSNGRGFNSAVNSRVSNAGWNNKVHVADMNGDGLEDMLVAVNGTWKKIQSYGSGFNQPINTGRSSVGYAYSHIMDTNYDNIPELVYPKDFFDNNHVGNWMIVDLRSHQLIDSQVPAYGYRNVAHVTSKHQLTLEHNGYWRRTSLRRPW